MIHENEEAFFTSIGVTGCPGGENCKDSPLNEESPEVMLAETKPDVTVLVGDRIHRSISFRMEAVPPADVDR